MSHGQNLISTSGEPEFDAQYTIVLHASFYQKRMHAAGKSLHQLNVG
jgi:hypothetical protein